MNKIKIDKEIANLRVQSIKETASVAAAGGAIVVSNDYLAPPLTLTLPSPYVSYGSMCQMGVL
jgi:hypothetical protein